MADLKGIKDGIQPRKICATGYFWGGGAESFKSLFEDVAFKVVK